MSSDLDLLEDFVLNNPELDRLEKTLSTFNVFETLSIVDAELRHSNMIAWLLNPESNHGLGEVFLKQFLKLLVSRNKQALTDISLFDFEILSYADVEVRREWNNIDLLLILNEENARYVVAIENKIFSLEHGDQLNRYRTIIRDEFGHDSKTIFVYLTPDNAEPTDEKWVAFSYIEIADLLKDVLERKKDTISQQIYNFISHYEVIVRRYLVGSSEVELICQKIYKKHQKALDLIFQYKPDIDLEISEYLQEVVSKNQNLISDVSSKTYIRFTSKTLDSMVEKCGDDWTNPWTSSRRILLYEFRNANKKLTLKLYIGLGPKELREKLRDFCIANAALFKTLGKNFGYKWHTVYQKEFLKESDFEEATSEDLKKKIDSKFDDFLRGDAAKIDSYFKDGWVQ